MNPNRLAFETVIASLELPEAVYQPQLFSSEERTAPANLPSALAFASGSAVTQAIVSSLVKSGGHIISVSDVYGGTYRYLTKVAPTAGGVRTSFVEMSIDERGLRAERKDLAAHQAALEERIEAAFEPETQVSAGRGKNESDYFAARDADFASNRTPIQLVWIETPTNPTLRLVDIALVAKIAHRHNAVVVVDNTFMSPYYQRPLELGADIVSIDSQLVSSTLIDADGLTLLLRALFRSPTRSRSTSMAIPVRSLIVVDLLIKHELMLLSCRQMSSWVCLSRLDRISCPNCVSTRTQVEPFHRLLIAGWHSEA